MLVTAGAVVLCAGSPLMAWATSTLPRRELLTAAIAAMAIGHVVSAFAPDFVSLAAIRIAMLIVGAVYTPLAASTISLLVPEKERPSAIAFIFLGWSLAIAAGLPVVTYVAANFGWRACYGMLGAVAAATYVLLLISLPAGLRGAPLSMKKLERSRAQPVDRAAACDHGAVDLRPVRAVPLPWAADRAPRRRRTACHRRGVCRHGRDGRYRQPRRDARGQPVWSDPHVDVFSARWLPAPGYGP